MVRRAYDFGAEAHSGQTRMSGERYISHPIAVASILADLNLDYQSIAAAILHDVIEDTPTAKEQIVEEFGEEVAELVDGVSKLDQIQFKSKAEAQAESLRKMMLAMARDIRVILLKLADRLHNMRTLGAMPVEKRRRIARETLEIYAPIANRLGINDIRLELEDLGFRNLYPKRYQVIERSLKEASGGQKRVIKRISAKFQKTLLEQHILAEVTGREKHIYSVYLKMRRKELPLDEIVDVYGFRIVVDDVDQCYRVLGQIHRMFRPMLGRFKDYIAIPRLNGYQSLHTTLVGPKGMPLEVQIRTRHMDNFANSGIAAHWLYKTDQSEEAAPQKRAREWLSKVVDFNSDTNSEEFLENVKIDLFPDKVYVFTPRGDILRLPRGSTPIDFAYAVHTDIGDRCVGATVDRRRVPLRSILKNGQTVSINTRKGAHPSPAWLNFVVTAKARSAIRHYLKNLRASQAVRMGLRLLENALAELDTKIRKVPTEKMDELLSALELADEDKLYEEIGMGHQLAPLIARRLVTTGEEQEPDPQDNGRQHGELSIAGTEGMFVNFGKCCYPVPGDAVMGYLSTGRGLVVHRHECGNLAEFRKQPDKWINVSWQDNITTLFTVAIKVEALDKVGVLASVAARISDANSNIEHVEVVDSDGDASSLSFMIKVKNAEHLRRVIKQIDSMPDAILVERVCA
ncbi:MAG: bifunctional (p)ppGpp synthetase/guanosine-3',5'-bis(diphosphate) 3'-pyrophosphohydrolase [Gammaproteobacteria bacterium]|nr:bifunctional (p)ppGpp synthetase/guanosine-3',5'-bis(diphosphate) 3'-pyrophosphohydrolase [Gammaproteobacteria bacterium]